MFHVALPSLNAASTRSVRAVNIDILDLPGSVHRGCLDRAGHIVGAEQPGGFGAPACRASAAGSGRAACPAGCISVACW